MIGYFSKKNVRLFSENGCWIW